MKIYLAGPDVFLPNAREIGTRKVELCRGRGFEGLFPLDPEVRPGSQAAAEIFRANCDLLERADVGLFNLTPFRGPSADVGTAFELGFLFARSKPVYGYTSDASLYADRVARQRGPLAERGGRRWDRDNLLVEDFGQPDNLMLARAIEERGVEVIVVEEAGGEALAAFSAFEACLDLLKSRT